jgi:AraC-like DNA-binding protein
VAGYPEPGHQAVSVGLREYALARLGDPGLAEIAARWGFRSAAHFTRAFRARYGLTPAEHRRAARPPLIQRPLPS